MFSTKSIDKTQAFDGLAKNYDKARPSYPKELFFSIFSFWRSEKIVSEKPPTIADVGCGTGSALREIKIKYLRNSGRDNQILHDN